MKKITCLSFILISLTFSANAQNVLFSHISWTADKAIDLKSNDEIMFQCVFKTQGNLIEWIQKEGVYVQQFYVQSTEGSWGDVQSLGQITFHITHDGVGGTLVAKRNTEGVIIIIDFTESNQYGMNHQFRIKEITVEK